MTKNILLFCLLNLIAFPSFSESNLFNNGKSAAPLGEGSCHVYSKYKINNGTWSTPLKTAIDVIISKPDTIVLNANDSISFNIYFDQIPCIDYFFNMNQPQWFFNGTIIEGESTPDLTAKDSGEYKIIYYEYGSQIVYTHIFNIIKPTRSKENKFSCSLYSVYAINGTWSNPQKSNFKNTYFSLSDTINLNLLDTIAFYIYKDGPDCGNEALKAITPCRWYFNDSIPIEGVFRNI
jgi:hypothetical protein